MQSQLSFFLPQWVRYPATVSYRKPSLTSNAARLRSHAKRRRGAGPVLSHAIPTFRLEQSSSSARRKRRRDGAGDGLEQVAAAPHSHVVAPCEREEAPEREAERENRGWSSPPNRSINQRLEA
nr:unnamed protein product [Digitaria exilis]